MASYIELPGLEELVLEESYVLGVRAEPGSLVFEMDFVLTTNHPAYAPPPPAETECFRRGTLRFVEVRRLRWDDQGSPPATDATGERDYGHIDSLRWEGGRYLLAGDWGEIDCRAASVEVDFAAS